MCVDVLVDGSGTARGLDALLHALGHCAGGLATARDGNREIGRTLGDVAVHGVDDNGDLGGGHGWSRCGGGSGGRSGGGFLGGGFLV